MTTKRTFLAALALMGLAAAAGAQEAPATNPLTITGSLQPRTEYTLSDGTGYSNLSAGPGGSTWIQFADKVDKWTNIVVKITTPYVDDKSGSAYTSSAGATNGWVSGLGVQSAYASTDILGELGIWSPVGLKLQAGLYRLKPPVFSRGLNFGFGTGEDFSRAEIFDPYSVALPGNSYESYKWNIEVPVTALKDVFPVTVRVGSDLDFTGKKQATGYTGYAEVAGRNLYLFGDTLVIDWVGYYTLKARDAAPSGANYVSSANVFGGELSAGFGFENGLSVGLGAAADVAIFDYKAKWNPLSASVKSYTGETDLNWQAGIDVTQKDWAKVYGAFVHRTFFDVDLGTTDAPNDPANYTQNFVAFRIDLLPVANLTPYVGGSYVLGNTAVVDKQTNQARGAVPANSTKLAWEAGASWAVSKAFTLTGGFTKGSNSIVGNFPATLYATNLSDSGAIFGQATWKF